MNSRSPSCRPSSTSKSSTLRVCLMRIIRASASLSVADGGKLERERKVAEDVIDHDHKSVIAALSPTQFIGENH